MKSKIFPHSILVTFILFLAACQPSNSNVGPNTTATAQDIVIPVDTPSPTPVPLTISFSSPEWEGTKLDSICVDVKEGQSDEVEVSFLTSEYHQKQAEFLLQEIGLKTAIDSAVCDATLNIALGFSTSYTTYTETNGGGATFDCLTGVYFSGLVVMTAVERPPLYADVHEEVVDEPYLVIGSCPEINNSVNIAWTKAVLKNLAEFMGPHMITFLFESNNDTYRTAALLASEALGTDDIEVLPNVVEALNIQSDYSNVVQIATGIQNMGPVAQQAAQEAVPSLIEQLESINNNSGSPEGFDSFMFQQPFIDAFGKLGPGAKEAVPLLVQMLQSQTTTDQLQDAIVQALGDIGPNAMEAVPELKKLIDNNYYATESLRKIEPLTPDVIAALMDEAKNYKKNSFAASRAMETLGELTAESEDVLPFLISAAKDSDPNVAANAMLALGKLGPVSPEILPILKNALSSSNETLKQGAARALGDFGPDATETIPLLIAVINSSSQYSLAKNAAISTLGRIGQGSPDVVPVLIQNFTSGAEQALEQLGAEARPAIPALIKALEGENVNPYFYEFQAPYVRALIAITGEYHGFKAEDWQTWWDAQPK